MEKYRSLSTDEIAQLEQQGCRCANWSTLTVSDGFNTASLRNAEFSGDVSLGRFEKRYVLEGGLPIPSGIVNARLHNCSVGDDALIRNIGGYLANCDIAPGVIIMDTHTVLAEGKCLFGNDTDAHVLNETGGREVPIYNELSAQIGYILAMYRYRPLLISRLKELIREYAAQHASHRCRIGAGSKIINCGSLRNVNIGEQARLYGVASLENGSVNSTPSAHTRVGSGVVARDFIFSSGAIVSDGAQVTRTFVGQACHVGHLFSAHDSLLFSNCQLENGEACAVLAGPYSVSMHKSSLLIAAVYSFLNAGSGFNQSNHLYKLGPVHQGFVERGGRMASDSYILWPAKIGAFSLVMGRHMTHLDTSLLPFSYIVQAGTESLIMPGANLQRVGIVRDSFKWPERDKRTDPHPLDIINFNLFTPYTMEKILHALEILRTIERESAPDATRHKFHGGIIKHSSLERGIQLYEMAVRRYVGNALIRRLSERAFSTLSELHTLLARLSSVGLGEWADLCGMIVPRMELNDLLEQVENQEINHIGQVQEALWTLQGSYDEMEWNWNSALLESWYDVDPLAISIEQLKRIVRDGIKAADRFDEMLLADAAREFHQPAQIGFGADGNEADRQLDFREVRGAFDDHPFVLQLRKLHAEQHTLCNALLLKLDDLEK